jgi:O-antigen ligase
MASIAPAGPRAPHGPVPLSAAARAASAWHLPAALRRPRRVSGMLALVLLLIICMLSLNALGMMALGSEQLFSYGILALCLFILLVYQFNVPSAIGKVGKAFYLYMAVFLLIAVPNNVGNDPMEIYNRLLEIRMNLSSALVVAACAVGTYGIARAYSPKSALRLLGLVALLVPAAVYVGALFPGIYRFREAGAETGRFTGFFGNANSAGSALCAAAAIGFACLVAEKRRSLVIAGLVVTALAVMLTFSRGAFLTAFLLAGLQIFISPVLRHKSILLAGVGIVMLMALLVFQAARGGAEKLEKGQQVRASTMAALLKGDLSAQNTGGRFYLAMNGLKHWLESPIIGHGVGGQRRVGEFELGAHNTFIRILGEGGIISGAFMFGFLWVFYREARRCPIPPLRTLALGYLFVFFMACMTSHGVMIHRHHNAMLGITFGMLAAAREIDAALRARALRGGPRPAPALAARPLGA